MRARTAVPLLFSCCFLVFTALLLVWGSPSLMSSAEGLAWTDLRGPTGGEANVIAFNPAYPADETVLAGGGHDYTRGVWYGEGVLRSQDGGRTWGPRGGPPRGALLDIAFSPRWQDDGLAAAGFWQGLWLTEDRGATWRLVLGQVDPPSTLNAVAISSPAPGAYIILAGGPYGGFHRSVDGGKNWESPFEPGGVSRIVFDPTDPDVALLASATGIWRSTDAGIGWTRITTTTSAADVAVDGAGHTYAIFAGQAWRSDNAGSATVTWQPIAGSALARLMRLGLSADGAGLFMAAGADLYRYDLAANALVTVTTNIPGVDIRTVVPSPQFGTDQTLLVGTNDGVWISQDAGATLVRSEGFRPLQIYRVAAAPPAASTGGEPPAEIFAGGEGGVYRRTATGWQPLNSGTLGSMAALVVDLAVSPAYATDHTLFAVKLNAIGLGSALLRSTTGGQNWDAPSLTLEYMNQAVISPDFAHDRRIYVVGSHAIWASTDGGASLAKLPFWDQSHGVRLLAISPGFAADQALVAVGDKVYRSRDAGASWQEAAGAPALNLDGGSGWTPHRLIWTAGGRLYLTIYAHETTAPYLRHDQIWSSSDQGNNWTQLTAAPDLPFASLAAGPSAFGSGEAIYASTFDSDATSDPVLRPDLYVSRDAGATWQNLGAIPQGSLNQDMLAYLEAPAHVSDQLWAGTLGVWQLDVAQAPTATPNPVHELLANRSFEYTGVWRIPDTPYDAAYSRDQAYAGYWSMRAGITDPAANIFSYSDFSQDVTLPMTGTAILRFHRRQQVGAAEAPPAEAGADEILRAPLLAPGATLEDFYRALAAGAGDRQYVLLIERPSNQIHYLDLGLGNERTWEERSFDLSPYLGKSVRLQFGVYNDGSGLTAAQYIDAVSLESVEPAAPTITPTVMPTAIPTGTPAPVLTPQMWLPEIQSDPAG